MDDETDPVDAADGIDSPHPAGHDHPGIQDGVEHQPPHLDAGGHDGHGDGVPPPAAGDDGTVHPPQEEEGGPLVAHDGGAYASVLAPHHEGGDGGGPYAPGDGGGGDAPAPSSGKVNERWEARLAELVRYREESGGKMPTVGRSKLGTWVDTQRTARKRNKLSAERIRRLDEAGFDWFPGKGSNADPTGGRVYEERWEASFAALKAHAEANGGESWVGRDHPLFKWCKAQRKKRSSGKMPEGRVALLEGIGFRWSGGRGVPAVPGGRVVVPWRRRYEELAAVKAREGHCDVNSQTRGLGLWVKEQRKQYKLPNHGKLTPERVALMESIGFRWSMTAKRVTWDERFAQLVEHYNGVRAAAAGMATVVEEGAEAEAEDGGGKAGGVKAEGAEPMDTDAAEGAASEGGVKAEGAAAVKGEEETSDAGEEKPPPPAQQAPPELAKDHPLSKWMAEQRSARRRSLLSRAKIDRLDGIGFDWGPKCRPSHKWHERIEQLRAYKAEHGDLDVPYGHPVLGTFVNNTRSQHRMNRLREERVKELAEMGFVFVTSSSRKGRGGGAGGGAETGGASPGKPDPVPPPALPSGPRVPDGDGAAPAAGADAPDPPAPPARRTRTETVRLTVGAGSIGLEVDATEADAGGRGMTISAVSEGCSFRDHVSAGDRILSVNGRAVVGPEDLSRDEDRDRELVFEVARAVEEEEEEDGAAAAGDATMGDAGGEGAGAEVASV